MALAGDPDTADLEMYAPWLVHIEVEARFASLKLASRSTKVVMTLQVHADWTVSTVVCTNSHALDQVAGGM